MVGRPKTRLKRLYELHGDLEQLLGRLIVTAPRRSSSEQQVPRDRIGLLWREAIDGLADAFLAMERTIEGLGGKLEAAEEDGDSSPLN